MPCLKNRGRRLARPVGRSRTIRPSWADILRSGAALADVGREDDSVAEIVARPGVVVPAAGDEPQRRPAGIPVDARRGEPGLQVLGYRICLEYRRAAAAQPDIYPVSGPKV